MSNNLLLIFISNLFPFIKKFSFIFKPKIFVKFLVNSKKMKSGIFGADSISRPGRGALMTEQKLFSHTKM